MRMHMHMQPKLKEHDLLLRGKTDTRRSTLLIPPQTVAISCSSTTCVPWPLRRVHADYCRAQKQPSARSSAVPETHLKKPSC